MTEQATEGKIRKTKVRQVKIETSKKSTYWKKAGKWKKKEQNERERKEIK